MKQTKYRLNTLLDLDIAIRLKAYAGFKGLTLAEAIEKLLRKPLVQMGKINTKTKKDHIELDLKKINAVTQEALKEYREGKTIPIDDFNSFAEEIRKAAQ